MANNIRELHIFVGPERIWIVTEDSEYGELSWSMDAEGHLFCADGSTPDPEAWEPVQEWTDDDIARAYGDAAMQLEKDTMELVRAAFKLDLRKP